MSAVIITGGAGFIGSRLADLFIHQSHDVTVIDDLSTGDVQNVPSGCAFVNMSVEQVASSGVALDCDVLIHLAAQAGVGKSIENPGFTYHNNVSETRVLFDAAARSDCRRLIFTSSSSVYGNCLPPQHEQMTLAPRSPYAASKMMGEALTHTWAALTNRPAMIVRPFNVYGPKQPDRGCVIPAFCKAIVEGTDMQIEGDGKQSRDFTFVDDVCSLFYAASAALFDSDLCGTALTFNACNHQTTTIEELAVLLKAISGKSISISHVPPRVGDIRTTCGLNHYARNMLDWTPMMGISKGLEHTLEWWRRDDA